MLLLAISIFSFIKASLVAPMVKNLPAMQKKQENWVRSLGQEDPVEKGMATYSSIRAWENPTDRGAWQATVHGLAKSQTQQRDYDFHFHMSFAVFLIV